MTGNPEKQIDAALVLEARVEVNAALKNLHESDLAWDVLLARVNPAATLRAAAVRRLEHATALLRSALGESNHIDEDRK